MSLSEKSRVTKRKDTIRIRVADIPGLIDGAHQNRGLGHEFLRHVARTRVLMFVVDAAGSEGRDPVEDFMSLKEELRLYDDQLSQKPAFVVANKTDLPGERSFRGLATHVRVNLVDGADVYRYDVGRIAFVKSLGGCVGVWYLTKRNDFVCIVPSCMPTS